MLKGVQAMMPYDTYRLYQIERAPSPAEVRYADEQPAWHLLCLRYFGVLPGWCG
jgi:hypothetical protein